MSPSLSLDRLRSHFMVQIAMLADENRVGCEDGPDPVAWELELEAAIQDGLEEAYKRKAVSA